MDKKIRFLDIIQNDDKTYDSAKVIYSDGEEEIVHGDDEVITVIAKFSIQERNSELLEDNSKVRVVIKNKEVTPTVILPMEEIANEEKDSNTYNKNNKEHKGKGKVIGTVATISGLVITAAVVAICSMKGSKGFSDTKSSTPSSVQNNKSIIREVKDEQIPYNGSLYPQNIRNVSENDSLINEAREYLNGDYTSYDKLMSICDGISMRSGANMNELSNLINGGRMNGDYYELHLEPMFVEGSFDSIAVESFCNRRNNIVKNAYNQNSSISKREVKEYLDYFIDFLYNGKTMQGRREFDYLDLSKLAQYDIVSLGLQMLTTCNDYSKNIHGTTYNAPELSNKIYNDYYGFLMEDLEASIIKSY